MPLPFISGAVCDTFREADLTMVTMLQALMCRYLLFIGELWQLSQEVFQVAEDVEFIELRSLYN